MKRVSEGLNIDLNLMLALEALLEEKSVTRAAHRLHLSQPTLSVALAKLRQHFGDPLLVRVGAGYELTTLAEQLAAQATNTVESARRLFDRNVTWNPSDATREFTVIGADYGFSVIGPTILALTKEAAPNARLRFTSGGPGEDPLSAVRQADIMLRPHGTIVDLPFDNIWRDRWIAITWAGNTQFPDNLTIEDVETGRWVLTHHSQSAFTSAGLQLRESGITLNVDAVVDSFYAIPSFLIGSERKAIVPERLLATIPGHALRQLELPVHSEPIDFAAWWHPAREADPEHAWFRSLFRLAGRIVSAKWRVH